MDNGQPVNPDKTNRPLFTAGVGVDTEKVSPSEEQDNLNSDNFSFNQSRDLREIGNTAINSSEIDQNITSNETSPDNQALGEVTDVYMPPNSNLDNPINPEKPDALPPSPTTPSEKTGQAPEEKASETVSNFEKGKIGPAELVQAHQELTDLKLKEFDRILGEQQ